VTDMEKGLVPAIREVFPDVPHQYCQLHYLERDVIQSVSDRTAWDAPEALVVGERRSR